MNDELAKLVAECGSIASAANFFQIELGAIGVPEKNDRNARDAAVSFLIHASEKVAALCDMVERNAMKAEAGEN